MQKLEYNGLFVDNNTLSVNSTRFYMGLRVEAIENDIVVKLKIGYSDEELTFYSIEEAFAFIKEVLKNEYKTEQEVFDYYYQKKEQGELAQKVKVTKTTGAFLTKDNIYSAICGRFGKEKNYKVSATSEQYDAYEGGKNIFFYLVEHLDYDGIKKDNPICLTGHDVREAIEYYLSETEFVFVDFKEGYPFKLAYRHLDNGVTYEGLDIIVAEKDKTLMNTPRRKVKERKRKNQDNS